MTDRPCVFVSRPLLGSVCSCPSFSPHTYTYYTKNAIDTHRSLNRRGFYLFRFFRSLIIYSSTERRRDNEVISMSLTVNSKPSLLLLILVLFFFSLLLPTDEYMNRNEQSSRKRTDSKYRRTSSTGYPGNRKGNHPLLTVSHCNNLGWCTGATLASITLMMTTIFANNPSVRPPVHPLPYLRHSRFSLLTRAEEDASRLFSGHQCHHPPRKPDIVIPSTPHAFVPTQSCGEKRRNEPRTKNRSLYKIATVAGSGNQYPAR